MVFPRASHPTLGDALGPVSNPDITPSQGPRLVCGLALCRGSAMILTQICVHVNLLLKILTYHQIGKISKMVNREN